MTMENEEPKQPEEQQADEGAADEGIPEAEDTQEGTSGEQPAAEQEAAEEPEATAEEPEEPAAEEAPAEEAPQAPAGEEKKQKKEDVVPGAELDPIAIEPDRPLDAEERARREAEEEERARRERELIGEVDAGPVAAKPAELSGDARYIATGKRKSSIARVIVTPGSGNIEINKRKLDEYFPRAFLQTVAKQALVQSGYESNVDVRVRVHGGGVSGQAAAIRHGIARALVDIDPELRRELKRRGMLTRDARVKERRKAGLKKARKKPQFSKR